MATATPRARAALAPPNGLSFRVAVTGTGKNTTRGARARTRVVTRITQTNLTTVSTHQRTQTHDSTTTETAADSTAAAPEPTAPRGRLRSLFTGAHGRTRAHGSHRQTSQPSQHTNAPTRTIARRPRPVPVNEVWLFATRRGCRRGPHTNKSTDSARGCTEEGAKDMCQQKA